MAYLRVIASESDDIAFSRIVNVPPRKFGEKAIETLRQEAEKTGSHLYPTLKSLVEEDVKPFNRPQIRVFVNLIEQLKILAPTVPVSELTDKMMTLSGLGDMYRTDEQEERLENIAELVASMKEFELTRYDETDATLDHYLQEISLYTNPDFEREGSNVRLMTIHQSKGLEFPVVFIVGLTEGTFPNHRSIRERRKDGEEEERRLMYVAVTRAEDILYLSESEGFMNDTGAHKYPSRFISEIDLSLLEVEGNPDPKLLEGTKSAVDLLNAEVYTEDNEIWKAGTKVSHKVFGEGVIASYDSVAKSYLVKFSNCERQLLPKFLKLL